MSNYQDALIRQALKRDPWYKSIAFYLTVSGVSIGVAITVGLWLLGK